MTEEELLDGAKCCPTMYFDGYGCYRKVNGVLRCVGFVYGVGAQLNLVISLEGANRANRATRAALDRPADKLLDIWRETASDARH